MSWTNIFSHPVTCLIFNSIFLENKFGWHHQVPPWTMGMEKDCVISAEKEDTLWPHHPQASTVLHQESHHRPMVSPMGREPKVDIQLSLCYRILCRRPTRVLPHRNHGGNMQGLTPGDQMGMEKDGRPYNNQCSNLAVPQSCLQWHWSRNLSKGLCPSAELS